MNQKDWDSTHQNYRNEVVSVFHQDTDQKVLKAIDEVASQNIETALDLGCGRGYYTEYLAERFSSVQAADFSETGLHSARSRCSSNKNVQFHNVDVTSDRSPFEPSDFVLCVNLLIMPSMDQRLRAWRMVTNQVKEGGTLLLVVPSLESIMMDNWYQTENHLLNGETCKDAKALTFPQSSQAEDLHDGVHLLDGVRTKHYLKEELYALLTSHHFDILNTEKIDYQSGAWDWLICAQRQSERIAH